MTTELTIKERLANMGDPHHFLRHDRTEWRVSRYPRVTPPPVAKGRRKGTRRERKAKRVHG